MGVSEDLMGDIAAEMAHRGFALVREIVGRDEIASLKAVFAKDATKSPLLHPDIAR
jgi:hypothetical protein